MSKQNKQYDVVVFGASSFVGQILVKHLWKRHGLKGEISWAVAGRSKSKMQGVLAELGTGAEKIEIMVCDADNESQLRDLCSKTKVVCSTVGPYALYGNTLVKVCAETGTDYCDLTGEVQWIERMITQHEATAKASGARIVHCCGFDSIPSDLGVFFLQQASMSQYKAPCQRIKMRVRKLRGEFSGGTVASLMNVVKEVTANPKLGKKLANPFLIAPSNPGTRQPNVKMPEFDKDAGSWIAPFVMAAINTRVVHRSNGLNDWGYGQDFVYDEAMMTGPGIKGRLMATTVAGGLAGFMVGATLPPTRWALERFVVPKPGEGPSPEAQIKGSYDLRFYGQTANGEKLVAKVTGDMDPGYGSTGKMLGEAAACLALDVPGKEGGFWTPATLLGGDLMGRLQAHAGLSFELVN
jgi:short subunit dehydrogenase-like uncharacterized protein